MIEGGGDYARRKRNLFDMTRMANRKLRHSVTLFSISDEYFCPQSYFLDLRGTNEGLGRYI